MTKIVSHIPARLAVAVANVVVDAQDNDPGVDWENATQVLNYLFSRKPKHIISELVPARELMRHRGALNPPDEISSYNANSLQQSIRDNVPIRFGEGRE